jgi:hypothetical protein
MWLIKKTNKNELKLDNDKKNINFTTQQIRE